MHKYQILLCGNIKSQILCVEIVTLAGNVSAMLPALEMGDDGGAIMHARFKNRTL